MRVNTIYPAIQGEGCLTGTPMILVRLQGCDLRCPWCDTKEVWSVDGGIELPVPVIVEQVRQATTGHQWVLVTGGEPTMQRLGPLVDALHGTGYRVALESNGNFGTDAAFDWVCISPKGKVDSNILCAADEVKYVVKDSIPDDVPDGPVICLQPVSQDLEATALCIETVQERGWRLSIQLHKYLRLP